MASIELLVIGAGPYGLAAAAYARARGIECRTVGEPMGFWKRHMPNGMLLRSGIDWHLDARGVDTLDAYLRLQRIDPAAVTPIPLRTFLDYAAWFQERAGIVATPTLVRELRYAEGAFEAELEDGERVTAANVVVATGPQSYAYVPDEVSSAVSHTRRAHTCDLVDFLPLRGRRCLIVGGRQSAFEWAALIAEQAGAHVHIVYRHGTPRFEPSDWSWVDPLLEEAERRPGWFRLLPLAEQEAIAQRFWAEGRLKLEPWLPPRLDPARVRCRPRTRVTQYRERQSGEVEVTLDDGTRLEVDQVVLATGYRVDLQRLSFLSKASLLPRIASANGYPRLDEHFQSSLPGLFFPGLAATRDFGPFFGFVRGCPIAARLIVERVAARRT